MSELRFENEQEEKEYYDALKKRSRTPKTNNVKEQSVTSVPRKLSLEENVKAIITVHSINYMNGTYELNDFDLDEHIVPMLMDLIRKEGGEGE